MMILGSNANDIVTLGIKGILEHVLCTNLNVSATLLHLGAAHKSAFFGNGEFSKLGT